MRSPSARSNLFFGSPRSLTRKLSPLKRLATTAKKRIMRESGIIVVDSPADIGKTVNKILK